MISPEERIVGLLAGTPEDAVESSLLRVFIGGVTEEQAVHVAKLHVDAAIPVPKIEIIGEEWQAEVSGGITLVWQPWIIRILVILRECCRGRIDARGRNNI